MVLTAKRRIKELARRWILLLTCEGYVDRTHLRPELLLEAKVSGYFCRKKSESSLSSQIIVGNFRMNPDNAVSIDEVLVFDKVDTRRFSNFGRFYAQQPKKHEIRDIQLSKRIGLLPICGMNKKPRFCGAFYESKARIIVPTGYATCAAKAPPRPTGADRPR